jgi:hypothetical protein
MRLAEKLDWKGLKNVTLTNSNSALPDNGDYTETCWSCFNVNFNTLFKAILLYINWCKNFGIKMHGTTVEKHVNTIY